MTAIIYRRTDATLKEALTREAPRILNRIGVALTDDIRRSFRTGPTRLTKTGRIRAANKRERAVGAAGKSGGTPFVQTGTLRRSITHQVEGNVMRCGTNLPYGRWLEFGTGPFVITPQRAKVLAFPVGLGGDMVFTRRVNHPGIKPRPWLRPAYARILARIKTGEFFQQVRP